MITGIGNVVGNNNIVTGNIGIANVGIPDSYYVDEPMLSLTQNQRVLTALSKLDSVSQYIEKHLISIEFVDGYRDTFMWGKIVAMDNVSMVHMYANNFSEQFLQKINRYTTISAYVMEGAGGCDGDNPNFVLFIEPYVSSTGVSYTGVKLTVGGNTKSTTTATGEPK
jgi:hypothetical protein